MLLSRKTQNTAFHVRCFSSKQRHSIKAPWVVPNTQLQQHHKLLPASATSASAAPAFTARQQQQQQQQVCRCTEATWSSQSAGLLQRLGVAEPCCSPEQLWRQFDSFGGSREQQRQHLQQHLDLDSCRLLLAAAAATCNCTTTTTTTSSSSSLRSQQELNQLQPLIEAAVALLPEFLLDDFQLLLQVAAGSRYIPDKEWLAALIYADTGGFERLYAQTPPAQLVYLFADLSAVLSSQGRLIRDTQQLLEQQQQQQEQQEQLSSSQAAGTAPSSPPPTAAAVAELSALQSCLQVSSQHLLEIQQDRLLAGELAAMGGYWLLRKLLPQIAVEAAAAAAEGDGGSGDGKEEVAAAAVLAGLTALPGLAYQVLDSEDADVLLQLLASQLQHWSSSQLAAALTTALPCLGQQPPSDGSLLAVLFAAAGAAAGGMSSADAGKVLVVLEQLPCYAPDAQVSQALLNRALQQPLQLTTRQLYQLLAAAQALGAAPGPQQLALLKQVLDSSSTGSGGGGSGRDTVLTPLVLVD